MASATLSILRTLAILIFTGWVCVWILLPTSLWRKAWHKAEDKAHTTIFGYYGLNFAVFTFPILAVAIIGFVYLHLCGGERRNQRRTTSISFLSNPVIIRSPLGIISGAELLMAAVFMSFLAWTFYSRISQDFKKAMPVKSLQLNMWQRKVMKMGTRSGLLAEACLVLLLLPVLRGMSVLQLLGIQFENSVRYHIWLGNAMMLFATTHGAITMFVWGIKHNIRNELSKWQRTGRVNIAGLIALSTGLIMWITSLPPIRRKRFELFYYTHHLYAVFIVFFLLHAGDRHFYTVFSGVLLFALDKLLRIIQSRAVTCPVSARILPCKAIELTFLKHTGLKYCPTSVIFVNIPCISRFQWHSFSITSSSSVDNERLSILIKCQGQWTNEVYNKIHEAVVSDAGHMMCLPMAVEGPYGPASNYYQRYDSLLLVAGGIGITPFLSILQEIAPRNGNNKVPIKVELIYAVKKSQDISLLNSILPLLQNQSSNQEYLKLKIFVTREERSNATVSELLHEISRIQTVMFDTKCSKYTVARPESLLWMAAMTAFSCVLFLASLLCLSRAFLHSEKMGSPKAKAKARLPASGGSSKDPSAAASDGSSKDPSWISDVIVISSFIIATICSAFVTVLFRWRNRNTTIPPIPAKQAKATELNFMEASGALDKHEIQFGRRPDFQDIFSKFLMQTGGSNIGVLVCGPPSMQQSVASSCRQYSHKLYTDSSTRKASFSFHSLNFAL